MTAKETARAIAAELAATMEKLSEEQLARLEDAIRGAKRVFFAGAGRSGLAMRAVAMRLMHLSYTVYLVGDTLTPAIGAGDLLLVGSGSGETETLVRMAQKAKSFGATLALVTIDATSRLGTLADVVVTIAAPTPKNAKAAAHASIQLAGSLFEQSLLLVGDALVLRLAAGQPQEEANRHVMTLHANLE